MSIFDQENVPATPAPSPPANSVTALVGDQAGASSSKAASMPVKQASTPSKKCVSARKKLEDAELRFLRLRNARVSSVSDRVDDANATLGRCVREIDWCGTRAAEFKKALQTAEAELERILDGVAAEEAKLFPLVQAVEAACSPR